MSRSPVRAGGSGKIPDHQQHPPTLSAATLQAAKSRSLADAKLTGLHRSLQTTRRFQKPQTGRFNTAKSSVLPSAKGSLGSSSCAPNREHNTKVENGKNRGAGVRGLAPAPFGEWSGTAKGYRLHPRHTRLGSNQYPAGPATRLDAIAVRGCHCTCSTITPMPAEPATRLQCAWAMSHPSTPAQLGEPTPTTSASLRQVPSTPAV